MGVVRAGEVFYIFVAMDLKKILLFLWKFYFFCEFPWNFFMSVSMENKIYLVSMEIKFL